MYTQVDNHITSVVLPRESGDAPGWDETQERRLTTLFNVVGVLGD